METKTYDKQTVKFITVLAENMPELSGKVMQEWIEKPKKELQMILAETFSKPQRFKVWKTVRIGGFPNVDAIREDIKKAGMKIGDCANDILDKASLVEGEVEMNLVLLSVADLGFKDGAEYGKICSRIKDLGLELCPAEVGPQLRLQYKDQPKREWIFVGMEPITDSDGGLGLFDVERDDDDLWLCSDDGDSDEFWCDDSRFVFLLPQVK